MALTSFDNEVFSNFAFYSTVSVFKMGSMSFLTGYYRKRKMVFSNAEDVSFHTDKKMGIQPVLDDADVERVRRNHRNDLENIPPFILVGLFYVMTKPDPSIALWHFRVFAGARILHTLAYQLPLPQPSRAIFHVTSLACTISMGVQVLMKAQY